jgi:hypothetical protein
MLLLLIVPVVEPYTELYWTSLDGLARHNRIHRHFYQYKSQLPPSLMKFLYKIPINLDHRSLILRASVDHTYVRLGTYS